MRAVRAGSPARIGDDIVLVHQTVWKGLAATALIVALIGWSVSAGRSTANDLQTAPPASNELLEMLYALHLDAESLAVCGCPVDAIDRIVRSVADSMVTHRQELSRINAEFQSFGRKQADLSRQIRGVTDSRAAREQYGDLELLRRLSVAERQSIHDTIVNSALAHVPETMRAVHATFRMNRAVGWEVPLPYLTVPRSETAWVGLRNALAQQRYASEHDEPLAVDTQLALIEAESDPIVARALTGLAGPMLQRIETSIQTAVSRHTCSQRERLMR